MPRTAPGHCVRSRPRRPTRLPGKQGQATKPAPECPRPKREGASGWAGQTGRQHQRLGTRRRAVVREQRRAWSGSPGTRSCAPHAHRHRTAQPTASPPRISDNVSERQKVTLLEMKCEVAGPERDRQQGHTVCGTGGREHRATGVAEWKWAAEQEPASCSPPLHRPLPLSVPTRLPDWTAVAGLSPKRTSLFLQT